MKRAFIIFSTLLLISFVSKAQSSYLSKGISEFHPATVAGNLLQETINTHGFTIMPFDGVASPMAIKMPSEGAFPKGSFAISLGIGLGNLYYGTGYGTSFAVNPTLNIDYAITDKLGIGNIAVGGTVSYSSTKISGYNYSYNYSSILVGLRGTYHFIIPVDKLDPYGGILLGYVISNNPNINSDLYPGPLGKSSGFRPGFFVGGHYFFVDHFGGFVELGYNGFSIFTLGITIKL
jgi:outer membrane protein W